jgi:hypothetical protein
VADALLGSCVKGTAHIDSDYQGLRRGETSASVKEFAQRSAGKALADHKDVPLAVKGDLAVVKYRLDTRVTKAGSDIELLLKGGKGIVRSGGPKSSVNQLTESDDAHGDCFKRREVRCVVLQDSGRGTRGLDPKLIELVSPGQHGAGHVLWLAHDP